MTDKAGDQPLSETFWTCNRGTGPYDLSTPESRWESFQALASARFAGTAGFSDSFFNEPYEALGTSPKQAIEGSVEGFHSVRNVILPCRAC